MDPGDVNLPPTEEAFDPYRVPWLREVEGEAVRQHLSHCRECADFVLAARAFAADETQLPMVETREMADGWKALAQCLEGSEFAKAAPRLSTNRLHAWALGLCLAIALLWAVGGDLSPWPGEANSLMSAESEWATDFELHSVEPWGQSRGANEVVEVRSGDVLILFVEEVPTDQTLILDIADPAGGVNHRMRGLKRPGDGLLNLRLPRSLVAAGHHDLTLRLGDGDDPISTYRIRVLPP